MRAIQRLNYHPSEIARSLATKKTGAIGFIIPDILNPIHAQIAKSFEDAMHTAGHSVVLCNSDEAPERELAYLQVLLRKQVDGIALTPTGNNRDLLFSLVETGKPLILLDRQIHALKADCVLFDNETGAYQAIRHLIELGHSRIGLINLPTSLAPGRERLQGYKRALQEAGIRLDPALVQEGAFNEEGQALAESLLHVTPRPTAVFCSSNRLLRGVLHLAKMKKLAVPEELAICAFDDVPHYADTTPSITAVSTSVKQFGSQAARLLFERVSGTYTGEPRIVRVPCHLNIRESTIGCGSPVSQLNSVESGELAQRA
jgi:LacI family transcriptional regulator